MSNEQLSNTNSQQSASSPEIQPWWAMFHSKGYLLAFSIIIILTAGLSALTNLPRLEDPRIDLRNVLVITPFPGASAARVEALVTDVIEDELKQLHEIKRIDSTSRSGMSLMIVELQDWTDNSVNEQIFSKIRDRLSDAYSQFPAGAAEPILEDKRGATSYTMIASLNANQGQLSDPAITSRLASELADRLRNVTGTELVDIFGDKNLEITVDLDPQQLASLGMTASDISQIIKTADPKLPAGQLRTKAQQLRLQVASELTSVAQIKQIIVRQDSLGRTLTIGDIAKVSRSYKQPESDIVLVNGKDSVLVAARMQTTVRVDHWTQAANKVIGQFEQEFRGSLNTDVVFEQNEYTSARLADLSGNLLLGCVLVVIVVFCFMGVRSALIVGLALPLSSAITVFSLGFFDEQIHQMSIFGIIIAIGLLIDNAIVVTDEIQTNLQKPNMSRKQALFKSVTHLFNPLFASTLTTILGFMPIFLLNGNVGDFIGSIAISVVMALIASLFISMTVIAGLAARYLPRNKTGKVLQHQDKVWWLDGVQLPALSSQYKDYLTWVVKRPAMSILFVVTLSITGFGLASTLGNVFFPSADRDQFQIYLWTPAGSHIHYTEEVVAKADAIIRQYPEVKQTSWLVGGSAPSVYYNQVMSRDNTPNFANASITTHTPSQASVLISKLTKELEASVPEGQFIVRKFAQGPPVAAPIGFDIVGPDLDTLIELGQQVRLVMSQVPGVSHSTASIDVGSPELTLDLTRQTAAISQLGLNQIASQLNSQLGGQLGGSVLEATEELPIRVRVDRSQLSSSDQLGMAPITSTTGQYTWVDVNSLGELQLRSAISSITRLNGERVNKIQGFLLTGATAIDVSREIQQKLDQSGFSLPVGYRLKLAGDADEQGKAIGQLSTYLPVLLVFMVTTLVLSFNSLRYAMVIGLVAMLAIGYGMLSLWLSGLPIGFNPLLGSAGLIGVVINGSIIVIAAINQNPLAKAGDIEQIVVETMGCSRHILSTSITTVGGFIPLLVFSEGTFWPPLAVVLAGGVAFSVLLSLVFTPAVMGVLGRKRTKTEQSSEQQLQTA